MHVCFLVGYPHIAQLPLRPGLQSQDNNRSCAIHRIASAHATVLQTQTVFLPFFWKKNTNKYEQMNATIRESMSN